jgi:carbonic anhydrase
MTIIDEALSANATEANTKEQIEKARSHPWISPEVPVRGFVFDVSTGRLSEVSPD